MEYNGIDWNHSGRVMDLMSGVNPALRRAESRLKLMRFNITLCQINSIKFQFNQIDCNSIFT